MRLQRLRKRLFKLLYFFIGLGIAYVFGCYFLAKSYLSPPRVSVLKPANTVDLDIPSNSFPIPVWCSEKLSKGEDPSNVVFIFVHGYGGSRAGWSEAFLDLTKDGFEAVAPALPGHDANKDPTTGLGSKEVDTVLDVVHWVRAKYKEPPHIILVGLSMGAATCWLVSEKEPSSIDAVVSECSFPTLDEAIDRNFKHVIPAGDKIFAPVRYFAARISGIDTKTIRPEDAASKWHKMNLVIQAGGDTLFPVSFGERLAKAARSQLWVVPGALHAECYEKARPEYHRKLKEMAEFFEHSGKIATPQ